MDELLPLSFHAFKVRRAEDWRYDASPVIVRTRSGELVFAADIRPSTISALRRIVSLGWRFA